MSSNPTHQLSSSSSSSSSSANQNIGPASKRARSLTSSQNQYASSSSPPSNILPLSHLAIATPNHDSDQSNSISISHNTSRFNPLLQTRPTLPTSSRAATWSQRRKNLVSILQKPELKRGLLRFVREQELGDKGGGEGGNAELRIGVERVKEVEQAIRRLNRGDRSIEDEDSNSDSGSDLEEEDELSARLNRKGRGGRISSVGVRGGLPSKLLSLQEMESQKERDLSYLYDLSLTLHYALKSRMESLTSPSAGFNQYSASPPRPPPPTSLLSLEPLLESLVRNGLSENDFPKVDGHSKFPSNNGGEVKMVRNRFLESQINADGEIISGNGNGFICVMKSTGKASARMHRKDGRMRVDLETKILLASTKEFLELKEDGRLDSGVPTPLLIASFQGPKNLHLIMEHLPQGDLDSFLVSANDGKRNGVGIGKGTIAEHPGQLLEERCLISFARDMVESIGWLHGLGIVHRDIKPANFLISPSGHLKLCDFAGSAPYSDFTSSQLEATLPPSPRRRMKRDQRDPRDSTWRPNSSRRVLAFYLRYPCGTPDYMAPEVLKAAEERERIDNWDEDDESEDDYDRRYGSEGEEENTRSGISISRQPSNRKFPTNRRGEDLQLKGNPQVLGKRSGSGLPRSNSLPEGLEYSLSAVPRSSSYSSIGGRSKSRIETMIPSSPTTSSSNPNLSFPRSRSHNEVIGSSSPSSKRWSKGRIGGSSSGLRADSGVGGINGRKSKILPTPSNSDGSLSSKRIKTTIPVSVSASSSMNSIKSSRSISSSGSNSNSNSILNSQNGSGDYSFDPDIPPINAQVPGSYGPEVDFWCLGLVLHECAFGRLPFVEPVEFRDNRAKIAEYMQYAITNCETTFKLDRSVPLSREFQDLISNLICLPSKRLGRNSTEEVKNHAFFRGTDWSRVWQLEAAYVPQSGSSVANAEMASASLVPGFQQPIYNSFVSEVPSFSKIFQGGIDEFPDFQDPSFEDRLDQAERNQNQGVDVTMTMHGVHVAEEEISEVSISKTIIPPPQAIRAAYSAVPNGSKARWAEVPLELVGFSYLPPPGAFDQDTASGDVAASEIEEATLNHVGVSSGDEAASARPLVRFTLPTNTPGPPSRFSSNPIASTPYGKGSNFESGLPSSTPYQSTPYHAGTVPRSLQRRAIEAAASRAEGISTQFVTPLRKTSMPNITSAFMSTPAPNQTSTQHQRPHVPPSPYPFPASAQRVISASGVPHAAIRRNDLDRARSETPGTGSMGSDSRCSGGSNAKRDVSEKDAYDDIMSAIKKSAIKSTRKQKSTFVAVREQAIRKSNAANLLRKIRETNQEEPKGTLEETSRPSLPRAATDTGVLREASSSNLRSNNSTLRAPQVRPAAVSAPPPGENQALSVAPVRVGALGGALMGFRSDKTRPPPILTRRPPSPGSGGIARGSFEISSEDELDALSALSSPDEENAPIQVPPPLSAAPSLDSAFSSSNFSKGSNLVSNEPMMAGRMGLKKQRSARQLLLKAQERTTPTKPTRAASPSLTVAFSERDLALPSSEVTEMMEELQTTSPERIEREIDRMDTELPGWNDRQSSRTARNRPSSMMVKTSVRPSESSHFAPNSNLLGTGINRSKSITRRKSASELPLFEGRTSSIGLVLDAKEKGEERQHPYSAQLGEISNFPNTSVTSLERTDSGRRMRRRSSREMLSEYRLGMGKPANSGKNSPSPTLSSPSLPSFPDVTEDAFFGQDNSSGPLLSGGPALPHNPSRSLRRASFANFGAVKASQAQASQPSRQGYQIISRRGSSAALREGQEVTTRRSDSGSSSQSSNGRTNAQPSSARVAQSLEHEQQQSQTLKPEPTLRTKRSSKWEKLGAVLGRGYGGITDRNAPSTRSTSSSRPPLSTTDLAGPSSRSTSAPLPKRVRALAAASSDTPSVGDDTADMSLATGIGHRIDKFSAGVSGAESRVEKLLAQLSADPSRSSSSRS